MAANSGVTSMTREARWSVHAWLTVLAVLAAGVCGRARASTPGLPFTEEFTDTSLRDNARTNANWWPDEGALLLGWKQRRYGALTVGTAGSDITGLGPSDSVAVGDVDGDGDLDLVVGNWNEPCRLYLNNGTANPFNGVAGSNITSDVYHTAAVALGDLDGDGDLDLVMGNDVYYGDISRVYLNNGTAAPFAGVTGSNIGDLSHSMQVRVLALGDLDGDGDLDLAVAGGAHPWLRIAYYLNNGTATPFQGATWTRMPCDNGANDVALGDMDGDGDLDIVAALDVISSPSLRLFLNNGTAAPFEGVTGSNITDDAYHTSSVALGDMDGDGDLDVVAGNVGVWGSYLKPNRLYLNNGTADPFAGVTGSNITDDEYYTSDIALGDGDGDGDLDVVAANWGDWNVHSHPSRLYLNNGTAEPFVGATGLDIPDTRFADFAALGDMDGDGDLDFVESNSQDWWHSGTNSLRLYLNNGTPNPWNGAAGADITASVRNTNAVALGDVDRDGDLDLVAGNFGQPNRLCLNDGTAEPWNGVSGSDVTTDTRNTSCLALGDVDRDGDLDLVVGNRAQANRLYLNNGTAAPWSGGAGSDVTADADWTETVALGDVDGDGDLDLVAGNGGQPNRLYLNNGTGDPFGGVAGSDITADADDTRSVALGDVDGDGDLDLIGGNYDQPNRLYLNNGTADPWNGVAGSDISADAHATVSVALGDMDRDGDLDLVVGNEGQPNRLYLNNGTADPFNGAAGSDITADAYDARSVALCDVDGDGDLDLVVGNHDQPNRLYLNNGTADPFSGATGFDIAADARHTRSVALGDVDGDGNPDLVAGNNGQTNRLYENSGTPTPIEGVSGSDIGAQARYTRSVALGDVDADGDLDVVAGNNNQPNRVYLNNGTRNPFKSVAGSDIAAQARNTRSVALGDVDGDGDLDLVAGNNNQPSRLYLNNGTADPWNGVAGADITADARNTFSVALGDVDRDGDLDLAVGNYGQANRLYLNNGSADPWNGVAGADITADAGNTFSVALGDVDRDGDLDLVAGNYGQANRLYLSNGTGNPWNGAAGSDITADARNTRCVALGDVDGDGDLDLVTGNEGQANRLYLNNATANPFDGVAGSDITADAQATYFVALRDVDRDGDLDLVAGNNGQPSRLYLNNGTASPFDGATGLDITTDARATYSLALGDVDGDGALDIVAGNNNQRNRLYRRYLYHTAHGRAVSLEVDTESRNMPNAMLTETAAFPRNTAADYWLSNNGGARWFLATPGELFFFPTTGTDLRWKSELRSLSPVLTPRIDAIHVCVDWSLPNRPTNVSPPDGASGVALEPTLQSSAFSDPDADDTHGASQWQLRLNGTPTDYSLTVFDSGVTPANLVSCPVPPGTLNYSAKYYWRVRHQDSSGGWSTWSSETWFVARPSLVTIHVPADYGTIQAAINAAPIDSEIIVSPQTYTENINFFGKNVALRSTAPTDPAVVAATVIDGGGSGSVVTFAGTEGASCVLEGFTITNGGLPAWGGGITGNGTYATIQHNVIANNTAWQGGAGIDNCDGLIEGNTIRNNSANLKPGTGGGVHGCDGTIRNNLILNNMAGTGGGLSTCAALIVCNTIYGNVALQEGGGVYRCWGGPSAMRNCILWSNTAPRDPAGASWGPNYCCVENWTGGGVGNITDAPQFVNPGAGDLHLLASSPCIDAGESMAGLAAQDFEGDARPYNGSSEPRGDGSDYDIGADEYSAGPMNHLPATPSNTSPEDNATSVSLTPTLGSSAFGDPDAGDTHAGSQWQIRLEASAPDYSSKVYDSGQSASALTACAVPAGRLNYETTYAWRVRHLDNHGTWSAWSAETRFATLPGAVANRAPDQPSNAAPADGQQDVSNAPRLEASVFSDPDVGDYQTAAHWRIRTAGGTYSPAAYDSSETLQAASAHQVPQGSLAPLTIYYWQVGYRDSRCAWSAWSTETSFKTVADNNLAVPEGLRAAAGARSVWLTWLLRPDSSILGYHVYRATAQSGPYDKITASPVQNDEYLDGNLTPETTYYYRMTAVGVDGGESAMTPSVAALVGATWIFMGDVRGEAGTTVTQHLTIDNPNQIANEALQVEVNYDKTMLTPLNVRPTILTRDFLISWSKPGAGGQLIILGEGGLGTYILGEGNVFTIDYAVNGSAPAWSRSPLDFHYVKLVDQMNRTVDVDKSSTAVMTVASPVRLGDVYPDGVVDIQDLTTLKRIAVGEILPTEEQRIAGDINGDDLLDSADIVLLRRMILTGGEEGAPDRAFRTEGLGAPSPAHQLTWGAQTSGPRIRIPLNISSLEAVAGMDLVVNFDPTRLDLATVARGGAADFPAWRFYAQDGQLHVSLADNVARTGGAGELLRLTFAPKGSWSETPLTVAKFKVSDANGVNLARTRTVTAENTVLVNRQPSRAKSWLRY